RQAENRPASPLWCRLLIVRSRYIKALACHNCSNRRSRASSDGADALISKNSTFDTKKAAIYLGLSKPYLDKLRCFGGGPRFAKLGRRVVYRVRDLDIWLDQHLKANTGENGMR